MNTTVPVRGSQPPRYNDLMNARSIEQVTLSVGGHPMTTSVATLVGKSEYFRDLFSGDWKAAMARQSDGNGDGTVFVDSDPEVFRHVLQYLRRGVFPLAYDQRRRGGGGHDYKLYADVLAEAQFFGIPKLERWLADRLYLHCVALSTVWSDAGSPQTTTTWRSDIVSTQLVRSESTTVRRCVCSHESAGRNPCTKKYCAVGGGFNDDIETNRWAEVGRSLAFHHGWCSDTG